MAKETYNAPPLRSHMIAWLCCEREELLEGLSLSVHSDVPGYAGSLEAECDFETSLAYSLGYGDSSLILQFHFSHPYQQLKSQRMINISEYVSVSNFPFEKFSVLCCCRTDRRA